MGIFSFAAGLLGGGSKKKASRKAESAWLSYLDKAIGEQTRQFDLTRADFQPYQEAGTAALGDLGDLVGINGEGDQASAIEALTNSPFYQSLLRAGEEGLLQTASATGGLRGGNLQRGLADFRADTLMAAIERQLSSLGGLAGMGQGATGAVANFGANKANAVSGLLNQQGAVRADGLLTRGNISAGMWDNAGSFLDSALGAALGAGAGPGGASFSPGAFVKGLF